MPPRRTLLIIAEYPADNGRQAWNPYWNRNNDAASSASGTLSQASEIAIGYMCVDSGTGGTGPEWALDSNNLNYQILEALVVDSTASVTAPFTADSGEYWAAEIITLALIPPPVSRGGIAPFGAGPTGTLGEVASPSASSNRTSEFGTGRTEIIG